MTLEYIKHLLNLSLSEYPSVILYGGCLTNYLLRQQNIGDIDISFGNIVDYTKFKNKLINIGISSNFDASIFIFDNFVLDLSYTHNATSQTISESSDYTVNSFAVDLNNVYCHPLAIEHLNNRILYRNNCLVKESGTRCLKRFASYIRTGFCPSKECYLDIISYLKKSMVSGSHKEDMLYNRTKKPSDVVNFLLTIKNFV